MAEWDFVDVGEIAIDPESGELMGGCDPRTDQPGENHPLFGSSVPTIPRDQWEEQAADESAEALVRRIMNQKSEGSCTAFNTCQNYEIAFARTFGEQFNVTFSPQSTFKRCASSPRGGSSISCNAKYARDVGYLLEDTEDNKAFMRAQQLNDRHVLDAVGFNQRWPQDYQQTAQYFRFAESLDIENFDQFATALLNGWGVSYGRAGHSICAVRLVRHRDQWAVRYANSWGNWGDGGFGVDTERYIGSAIRSYGAIAFRSIIIPDLPFATAV